MPGASKENTNIEVDGYGLVVRVLKEGEKPDVRIVEVKKNMPPPLPYFLEVPLAQATDIDAIIAELCGDGIIIVIVQMKNI